MTLRSLRINPPDNVLNSLCYEYLSFSGKFIFLAVIFQAALSSIPGKIRVRQGADWATWGISYEQIIDTLRAMATHDIIELTEEKDTFLIILKDWENYNVTDTPI